uniref:MCF.2 cell line derived transforming sequence n=1 Tax=Oreochromis niloticus TaxID=8128 RepID=I3J3H9_ORENI
MRPIFLFVCFLNDSELYMVIEVGGYIEKQVAYLSGGRGEDSSVIITLPECSAFSDIPEEALAKVFTYLTLIPRQPGVKFIIILDRRLDTWASIKTALARIAASFPGNLHLVLVLRPTSFFHRTVTDIGFRFSQEDFMLTMPVVMLSSVTDLLRYIDENQLTSEFGGTLDYCHSDWIVLRTAIESFAVTVKDIAQMLQGFGTELAEPELPEEAKTIECLLEVHTDKYRKLKDAIRSVSKEGRHLLSSLETTVKEDDSLWDVKLDWETVQRLLAQLRDMESAFDGFFEKHHLKLHQYLQLLRYEQSFQEMELCLEHLTAQERELCISANSLAETEQALKRLDNLESNAQEVTARAQIIILHGHQLSAGHHYAMALIMQRCNELRHYCDTLTAALKTKHTRLLQTHQMLLCLGQAQTWCDDAAYLLANQLVDKFQSKEGAQAALRDIEKLLEGAPSMLSSGLDILFSLFSANDVLHLFLLLHACICLCHSHVMRELIETERIYVEELLSVLLGYRAEMDNPALSGVLPPILRSKRDILFGNMPEIYNFHIFLQDLEGCLEAPEGVGACFLERKESFQMYESYCQNKLRSEALWRQFSDCGFFLECQKKLEHKLGLDSYLLKPIQRLTKYQLLLKELIKYSTDCEGTSELQGALAAMLDLLKSVNDSMHQIAITGYEGDICELGRVLMQGSFSVWISHKKGPTRMKEMARFKPMQRHLFLYERALLLCKRREEHGDGCDKTPSYSFKHCLKMTAVGITENVKGDVKKFEIWYSGREEVYVVQAPTVEVKMAWLNELRRILTNQQKLTKVPFNLQSFELTLIALREFRFKVPQLVG